MLHKKLGNIASCNKNYLYSSYLQCLVKRIKNFSKTVQINKKDKNYYKKKHYYLKKKQQRSNIIILPKCFFYKLFLGIPILQPEK